MTKRFVVDTNILISYLLFENSTPANAVEKALHSGSIVISEATIEELSMS